MGGRSGRGIRSPIGYASGYQNSYSDAEITVCFMTRVPVRPIAMARGSGLMGGGGSAPSPAHGRPLPHRLLSRLPKRVSPQTFAFALLLVSTVNLMFASYNVNTSREVEGGGGSGADVDGEIRRGGGGEGGVGGGSGGGGGGLGELGEVEIPDDASDEREERVSCPSLQDIDERDECLRERAARTAEREARDARRAKGLGSVGPGRYCQPRTRHAFRNLVS